MSNRTVLFTFLFIFLNLYIQKVDGLGRFYKCGIRGRVSRSKLSDTPMFNRSRQTVRDYMTNGK